MRPDASGPEQITGVNVEVDVPAPAIEHPELVSAQ
jgi:hypothetical protein